MAHFTDDKVTGVETGTHMALAVRGMKGKRMEEQSNHSRQQTARLAKPTSEGARPNQGKAMKRTCNEMGRHVRKVNPPD